MAALTLTVALLSMTAPLAAQPLGEVHGPSWRLTWDAVWTWARLSLGITTAKPHGKSARDAGCGIDPNGRTCE